jgi:biotin/methionine sulfoxide reductase
MGASGTVGRGLTTDPWKGEAMTTRRAFQSLAHWGAFTAHVEDGRLVGVTPFAEDPQPSPLIEAWPEMVYAENRIRKPSIRRGWLETVGRGLPHPGHGRGDDTFVEVSWDEALGHVQRELERVRSEYGNPSIFGGSYGWSSAGRLHHARTLIHRFLATIGGCTGQVTNYSYGAAMRLLPHVLGDMAAVAGPVTDWPAILENCERFVAIGGIAGKNWQIQSGGAGLHPYGEWMKQAAASGVSFVNVSPLRSDTADVLDAEWIQIRPGTDMALILATAWLVHARGKTDMDFVNRHCVGFDRFLRYLQGADDGVVKDPAWASEITGLSVEAITQFAESLFDRRVMLTAAWSLQRAEHGEQPYWGLVALAAMLGQIGLPGGGVAFGYGSMNGMGNPLYELPISGLAVPKVPGELKIPVARIADLLLMPGEPCEFDGRVFPYPDIKLVYWAGGNPFHHHQDLFRLREAFQRPDTIIVHEPWWTATARHADIVLPATTPLERNDIGGSSRDPYLFAMHKAIEPVGEARGDFEIFSALADRMGAGAAFHENRSEEEWLRFIYGRFTTAMAERGFNPPDFDTFWEAGHVRIPDPTDAFTLYRDFREDPVAHPLGTPSGKVEIFSETVAGFGYDECPGLPVWRAPSEWLGSELAARYPLHMISNQPEDKLHGQMDASGGSRRNKVRERAGLIMNPADAASRGLTDGDIVRVFNDRGVSLAGLRVSDKIMPGVVCLPTGATFDPVPDGKGGLIENHGNPNALTKDIGTSRLGQGPSAQTCLVEVVRHAEAASPITVLAQPAIDAAA